MFEITPTQFVTSNGVQLAVEHYGAGEPALILLHGLTANRATFYGLLQQGLANNRQVITLDLRGRGLSDKPAQGYSMTDHAADVLGLMDTYGIGTAVLAGHSFGGLLAFYIAAQHSARVERIVVMDAGKEATYPDTLPKIKPSLDRLGQTLPSWDAYLGAIKSSPYYAEGFWDEQLELYYRADVEILAGGAVRSRVYAAGIQEAVQKIIADDWDTHIRAVTCPAQLIHAPAPFGPPGSPPVLSNAGAQETLALLPNAQYTQVPGHHITMLFGINAGHVVRAIGKFLVG